LQYKLPPDAVEMAIPSLATSLDLSWTRVPARDLAGLGVEVRGGLGTIVGATFLGMGIACLETPTFKDLE